MLPQLPPKKTLTGKLVWESKTPPLVWFRFPTSHYSCINEIHSPKATQDPKMDCSHVFHFKAFVTYTRPSNTCTVAYTFNINCNLPVSMKSYACAFWITTLSGHCPEEILCSFSLPLMQLKFHICNLMYVCMNVCMRACIADAAK